MPAATSLLIASIVVAGVGTGVAVYNAQEAAGDAKHAAEQNAKLQASYEAEMAAANAKALNEQAQSEAERISYAADRTKKVQAALAAKAGLSVNQGTALDLTTETDFLAQKDINTVLGDAQRKGDLLKKEASGRAPLLMQNATDIGNSAQDSANASSTNAMFGFATSSLGTYNQYSQSQTLLNIEKAKVGNEMTLLDEQNQSMSFGNFITQPSSKSQPYSFT